jgi:hypothetical protein
MVRRTLSKTKKTKQLSRKRNQKTLNQKRGGGNDAAILFIIPFISAIVFILLHKRRRIAQGGAGQDVAGNLDPDAEYLEVFKYFLGNSKNDGSTLIIPTGNYDLPSDELNASLDNLPFKKYITVTATQILINMANMPQTESQLKKIIL